MPQAPRASAWSSAAPLLGVMSSCCELPLEWFHRRSTERASTRRATSAIACGPPGLVASAAQRAPARGPRALRRPRPRGADVPHDPGARAPRARRARAPRPDARPRPGRARRSTTASASRRCSSSEAGSRQARAAASSRDGRRGARARGELSAVLGAAGATPRRCTSSARSIEAGASTRISRTTSKAASRPEALVRSAASSGRGRGRRARSAHPRARRRARRAARSPHRPGRSRGQAATRTGEPLALGDLRPRAARPRARRVGVEEQHDVAAEPAQLAELALGQRGALRRDDVRVARLASASASV